MSDNETRHRDARTEQMVERNLRLGIMGHCWYCKDPTIIVDTVGRWCCSQCKRMMDGNND